MKMGKLSKNVLHWSLAGGKDE